MFNGPLKIYGDYKIVTKPILSNSAMNAIEFYVQDFSERIQYVWAHKNLFFTIYKQTKTTNRTAKKFSTNVVGHIRNRWLVRRVLESKNAKRRRTANFRRSRARRMIGFVIHDLNYPRERI